MRQQFAPLKAMRQGTLVLKEGNYLKKAASNK